MSHYTDLRKLLVEARDKISHEKDCAFIRVGLLKCTCYHQDLYNRIDAALAEKVEPVAWLVQAGPESPKYLNWKREPIGMARADQCTFTPLYAAPADQWRRVEDGLPHTDHPMRHYDRTCPACNTALPEGDK